MTADINILRLTGADAATATEITSASTRASTSDDASPGTNNPIPIPTSGSNYSYWVTSQLYSACAPDNAINNIKWYTDGANSFGAGINALVATASAYIQASGAAGSSGSLLDTGNHSGLTGAASDAFAYTSSCKLGVSGSIGATTGSFGDRVVYQLRVDTTASPGNSGEETFTWEYDET